MSDTSHDMDEPSVDGLDMYRLIDFDNLPQIKDGSNQNGSQTIFDGHSAAGVCLLSGDYSIDSAEDCSEKNDTSQVTNGEAGAKRGNNSDDCSFKDADDKYVQDASRQWVDLSKCPEREARERSSNGKKQEASADVGLVSSFSAPVVSHSLSRPEELEMSIKAEDNSPDSVRLVSVKRFSSAESDDRKCYGSSNMLCDPAQSSEPHNSSTDSSHKLFSNLFDAELTDEDSEPFGSYLVNADEIGEDGANRSTSQGNDEDDDEEAGDLPVQQRIRRKRLYRFSSSSSEDEHSELSISSSNRSSSKSGESSSPKVCKLDETTCMTLKDRWRQMTEVFGRQLGRHTTPDVDFQRRVGGSLGLAQKLELYTKYERHKGCVNALSFNDSGTLIASGSDDLQIVVWDWVRRKSYIEFDSGHRANVFQSKFMPYSGDCHIVSCARDGYVRLAQLSVTGTCKGTKKLAVHKGAAHKLAILPDSCHVFLSCGEDGVTYQIDLRQDKPLKLYTAKENNRYIALYSIHSHPFNAYEHCVGGRDQFVRIYDTRKIENNDGAGIVKKFCPHHLINSSIKTHVTCAVYNYNGTAVIGSYNDDDIYLFDNSHSDGANYTHKYSGHRNSATVKGVNFYGPKSEFVVSGSDCGNVYLWDVESEQVVNYFHADENGVVNVLEPHPHIPMLATSGLDNDVKLWLPTAEKPSEMEGLTKVIKKNKKNRESERNEPDIIDSEMLWFLMHRLRRSAARFEDNENDDSSSSDEASDSNSPPEEEEEDDSQPVQCTQS